MAPPAFRQAYTNRGSLCSPPPLLLTRALRDPPCRARFLLSGSVGGRSVRHLAWRARPPARSLVLRCAQVSFSHDALLVLEGASAGSERLWSTEPSLNAYFKERLASASVRAAEVDANADGKADAIDITVEVAGGQPVHGVKLALGLRYVLEDKVGESHAVAWLQRDSAEHVSFTALLRAASSADARPSLRLHLPRPRCAKPGAR